MRLRQGEAGREEFQRQAHTLYSTTAQVTQAPTVNVRILEAHTLYSTTAQVTLLGESLNSRFRIFSWSGAHESLGAHALLHHCAGHSRPTREKSEKVIFDDVKNVMSISIIGSRAMLHHSSGDSLPIRRDKKRKMIMSPHPRREWHQLVPLS